MINNNKRLVAILMILVTITSVLGVFPVRLQASTYLVNEVKLYSNYRNVNFSYKGTDMGLEFTVYKKNGVEYPAYPLSQELKEAGISNSYTVAVDGTINNLLVWRVITNGYPFVKSKDLGCNNTLEAYYATKLAVWDVLYNYNWNDFSAYNLVGERIIEAAQNISKEARNSNATPIEAEVNIISLNNEWNIDDIDESYLSKEYEVETNGESTEYSVKITGTDKIKIVNIKNEEQEKFVIGENFKLLLPASLETAVENIEIQVTADAKTMPILYGKPENSEFSDYALAAGNVEYVDAKILDTFYKKERITEIEKADLKYVKDCGDYLQAKDGNSWFTIVASYIEYTAPDGKKYPAYCLDITKPGVGNPAIGDLPEGYTVNISKILNNDMVYRAVINGYPYKTPNELGVKDKYDAYIATKQAVYSVLYDYDVDSYYRGIDERGENIKKAIKQIVKIAREGTQTQSTPLVKFEKIGEFKEDLLNNLYYSQLYNVTSDVDIKEYIIRSIKDFPEGTIVVDTKNKEKTTFLSGEQFKILIPKSSVKNINIKGDINVEAKCKSYPVFYGEKNNKLQPYAITYNTYGDVFGNTTLYAKMNTGKIQINKIDADTKNPIAGVTFELTKADGTLIANSTTGEDGIATFINLFPGSYKIKEISAKEDYVIINQEFGINIKYNEEVGTTIENELKKGQIRIIKVDKDSNDIKLQGVELEVLDENDNVIEKLITDENGEALTSKYSIRDFAKLKIREIKTLEEYELSDEVKIVELKEDSIIDVVFENEKIEISIENEPERPIEKEEEKKLPRTGF